MAASVYNLGAAYPAEGHNGFTSAQHRSERAGWNGIVSDVDGNAGNLTRGPEANTVHLSPVKLQVDGFVLDIPADVSIPIPTAAETYRIQPVLDPAYLPAQTPSGDRQTIGPIQILVGTSAECAAYAAAGSRSSWVLWEITRSASQAITAATLKDWRRWLGWTLDTLDPTRTLPTNVAQGSIAYRDGVEYRRAWTGSALEWVDVAADARGDWLTFPDAGTTINPGPGRSPQYRVSRDGNRVECRGSIERLSGDGGFPDGFVVGTLPTLARPNAEEQFAVAVSRNTSGADTTGRIDVAADGTFTFWPPATHIPTWISLRGITFDRT